MSPPRAELAALLHKHSVRTGDFVLASGAHSSHYVDVRRTSLTSRGATLIGELLLIIANRVAPDASGCGGLTLGADPIVVAMCCAADQAGDDWGGVLVRKEAKGHGTESWLESGGNLEVGAEVVVVDDVITTAGSTITAVQRLRAHGFEVQHALCVVDREAGGEEALAEVDVDLHALFRLSELAEQTDEPQNR